MAEPELKKNSAICKKKKFMCKQCNVVCSSRYGLAEHLRKHTGDRPFLCTQCNASFKRMMGLRKHQQYVHGAPGLRKYNCPSCKLVSANLGNVVRHYLVVHKTLRRFICSICLAQYSQNQELKSHLSTKHSIIIDNINSKEKKSISEVYVLPTFEPKDRTNTILLKLKDMVEVQKEKLNGIDNLILKIKNMTDTDVSNSSSLVVNDKSNVILTSTIIPESCDKEDNISREILNIQEGSQPSNTEEEGAVLDKSCPEMWISFVLERPAILCSEICYENCIPSEVFLNNQLTDSRTDEPSDNLPLISKKPEWKCGICQKTFSEEKRLFRHLKIHCNEKKYKCDKCDTSFREQHNLIVHYRTHSEERPYVCPVCGKRIRYHKDFVDHFVSHSGEKRYNCDSCSKKFPRKRDCDRHKLSHNPVPRFSCEFCGKGFSRRYLMLHHVSKHKKTDNPLPVKKEIFQCNICRKQYKTSQRFLLHKNRHTGMTEHQCHICSKSFTSDSRLQEHLRNHIPRVKNVTCSKCQRKFSSQDTLKIHMDRFHKPELTIDVEEKDTLLPAIEVPNYDYEIIINSNFND